MDGIVTKQYQGRTLEVGDQFKITKTRLSTEEEVPNGNHETVIEVITPKGQTETLWPEEYELTKPRR